MTPIAGQAGQATLTVTAQDPYGQSARGTLAVSIAAPATSSGGGGGGAFDYWSLLILGLWLAFSGGAASPRLSGAPWSPVSTVI
jgi:hypothetical protein